MQSVTVTTGKKELLASVDETISSMLDLMSLLDNKKYDESYADGWEACGNALRL